ncbi:MAG: DUF3467 domain-containing protein [Elusimicrobiota bacterium]
MEEKLKSPQPQFQIEIDDATARGVYANLALITHSETEFIMDFVFMQPQAPKAKVLSRIVSSPIHAKRLLWALKDNIEKYEARFGAIQAGSPAPPSPENKPVGFYQ